MLTIIRTLILIAITVIITACSPVLALAHTIIGKVTYIYDGDTLYLQEYGQNLRPHGRINSKKTGVT